MTREEAIRILASSCISGSKQTEALETLIPELAESEDESTRKALIETVKCIYDGDTMFLSEQQRDRYLAWLEKQKEQKPAERSEDELAKRHLEGYIMGREDTMREMKDFIESHFNTNKAREGEDLTDLYYKEYVRNPQPIPTGWGCDGIHCTNPHGDCINCPRRFTTGGTITIPNTASGTSTLKAEG